MKCLYTTRQILNIEQDTLVQEELLRCSWHRTREIHHLLWRHIFLYKLICALLIRHMHMIHCEIKIQRKFHDKTKTFCFSRVKSGDCQKVPIFEGVQGGEAKQNFNLLKAIPSSRKTRPSTITSTVSPKAPLGPCLMPISSSPWHQSLRYASIASKRRSKFGPSISLDHVRLATASLPSYSQILQDSVLLQFCDSILSYTRHKLTILCFSFYNAPVPSLFTVRSNAAHAGSKTRMRERR